MSKFLILDRDGTIIEDRGYLHKIEDLKFLLGAIDGLKKFRDAGYRFIVVTNQAGIARGIFTTDQLDIFHDEFIKQLRAEGITIDKIYHCPHHPEFTAPCSCRKPGTEMVQRAAKEFKFNPADCIYIGDKDLDIELGKNCAGITVLIENNQYPNLTQPDFKAKNLKQAFELLNTAGILASEAKIKSMHKIKKIVPLPIRSFLRMMRRHLRKPAQKIRLYILFLKDYYVFKKMSGSNNRFVVLWKNRNPQLWDNVSETIFDPHYLYHPAWATRILASTKPKKHIDISSILSFSTALSAFMPVEFYDYRPANIKLDNLKVGKADLLSLPFTDNSVESLSCMHTIEHIGLGRYGDNLDPDGDVKAMAELKRVVAKNGDLLFVVPIGKPEIYFNGHRVYSYSQIMSYFGEFELMEFSLIPDEGRETGIIKNATHEQADNQKFGCGLFWFRKK